jgi:glycosyltransferase involved in cell wall biosynthesis
MMRIVQFTTDNRNHFGNYGAEHPYFGTAPTGLLEGFAAMDDVEVHVVSCTGVRMKTPEKLAPNIHFHQPLVAKWGWGRSLFLGCVSATRKLLREIQPDIVHGQGTERDCAMEAVLSGYPNVLTLHGNMRVHAKRGENRGKAWCYYQLAALLETFCLSRTDGVVAISSYTEELVKPLTAVTWLLPNAVDSRFFQVRPDLARTVPRILFVGALGERKNPLGLLKACEPMLRAGACTLAFAGDGTKGRPYYEEFRRLASEFPGVEMLGFIGREALAEEFGKSTLLVLPTFEDNCPMVVLEAMAAGLPVAASRVGGVPDLIAHEEDGLMFDPADGAGMREWIERLVFSPELRVKLAEAGRVKALARFHPREVAEAHLRIYREVLSGKD